MVAGVATLVAGGLFVVERSLSRERVAADAPSAQQSPQLYADLTLPSPPSQPVSAPVESAETHGVERPPAGVDLRRRPTLDELRGRRLVHRPDSRLDAADAATAPGEVSTTGSYDIACIGNGTSGKRVVALYARAIDVRDRSAEVAPLIRQYAADADFRINRSAGEAGQGRRVRFATVPVAGGCEVDVRVVTLSLTGDDSFTNTRNELAAQGFNLADRKYLVWVDAAVGICGLGQFYRDTTPGATNRNNGGPMYARVDAPCWGYAETHELLHTLGAVQSSAAHSTANGHCTDENDVMCYADAEGVKMHSVCADAPAQWVDCGLDDYFNPSPPSGSYLAGSWNVANSAFLEGAPAPPEPPRVVVTSPDSLLAGSTVPASATVVVPEGRTFSIAWSTTRETCTFSAPDKVTTSFSCPATLAGEGQVTASVVDSTGLAWAHTRTFTFTVPGAPRSTALVGAASRSSVTYGESVAVTGRLTDAGTGEGISGMPVAIYGVTNDSMGWRQLASTTTATDGRLETTLRPALSTTFQVVSSSTGTWQPANSRSFTVDVVNAAADALPPPAGTSSTAAPSTATPQLEAQASGVLPSRVLEKPPLNRTIRITKVQYNAPGQDTRSNLNGEYLRLRNTGPSAITMTGWTVRTEAGTTYTFRSTRLRPGASITLFTGKGTATSLARFWGRTDHAWKNTGRGSARLRDEYARTVDSCSWTAGGRGYTPC